MTDEELRVKMKEWVENWKTLGPILEAERRERVRSADNARTLESLDTLFDSAVWLHPPNPTSGLVEQQRILMKGRR